MVYTPRPMSRKGLTRRGQSLDGPLVFLSTPLSQRQQNGTHPLMHN